MWCFISTLLLNNISTFIFYPVIMLKIYIWNHTFNFIFRIFLNFIILFICFLIILYFCFFLYSSVAFLVLRLSGSFLISSFSLLLSFSFFFLLSCSPYIYFCFFDNFLYFLICSSPNFMHSLLIIFKPLFFDTLD